MEVVLSIQWTLRSPTMRFRKIMVGRPRFNPLKAEVTNGIDMTVRVLSGISLISAPRGLQPLSRGSADK